jgi:outer membrane receptor for ferrienterochelin and colicins
VTVPFQLRRFSHDLLSAAIPVLIAYPPLEAQSTGTVSGTVLESREGLPLKGVVVTVAGINIQAVSNHHGQYVLPYVPAELQVLHFRAIGYHPAQVEVAVLAESTHAIHVTLYSAPVQLGDLQVTAANRGAERMVTAPAAVSVVDGIVAQDLSITGQAPLALAGLPGVDVVQSGINDFDVNTRGFNRALTPRLLVLLDGRDIGVEFGSQEWAALPLPLEDLSRVELIRGPGSALYGPNAYSGVLSLETPSARDVVGTKATLAAGGLGTIQGDVRYAGLLDGGRFGYRLNAGYRRSDTWTRSRTNLGDLSREYAPAIDTTTTPPTTPDPGFEVEPLNGQQKLGPLGTPGPVTGERDALVSLYGTARVEYYAPAGEVLTVEGGVSQVDNETYVAPVGRGQVRRATRPWARAAWLAPHLHAMVWYAGRTSDAISLAAGAPVLGTSRDFEATVQYQQAVLGELGRLVIGGSARTNFVNSEGTLFAPADDARTDWYYGGYAQIEYGFLPELRLLGAARLDAGDLFTVQLSPKAAIIYRPTPQHAIRLTFNRAFQTPTIINNFLALPAGPPADLAALEQKLRASALGPALAGVPEGALFTQSSSVPLFALGNPRLDVERVTSWELGFKGQLGARAFVTLDLYHSQFSDFVTELLPAVNPAYAPWTAPAEVPLPDRAALEGAVRTGLVEAGQPLAAAGLTRLPNGNTAIVVSFGNAGHASASGVEIGAGFGASQELQLEANYSLFTSVVNTSTSTLDSGVLPNTPKHKANVSLAYSGRSGLSFRLSARFVSGYRWASGIFVGPVPSTQPVDLAVGYRVNPVVRIHAVATNLLNQRRYQIYGGSVIGRRMLGGLTLTF